MSLAIGLLQPVYTGGRSVSGKCWMPEEELTLCPCLFLKIRTVQGLAPQALVSGLCPEGPILQHSDHSPAAQLALDANAGTE